MNTKTKRRLMVVTGVIIVVLAIVLAVVGSGSAAKTISVAEAAGDTYADQRVQVSGNVVDNSFSTQGDVLTFEIYDPEGDPSTTVRVSYTGAASSTFGNGVTAICTGKLASDGTLEASEMVTKCPSKYESASDALSVSRLLEYGDSMTGTVVKIAGTVKSGTLAAAGASDVRFVVHDAEGAELPVAFDGALADAITDETPVVITGTLSESGSFAATEVAQEG